MFDLSGMTALVTGASGGIGSAIARALVAQGAKVALSGTREDALKAVAAEIGGETVILPCDLGSAEAVDGLIPRAVEALGGKIDILVNNAGVTRDNLIMRMKDDEWNQVISVNLEAAFRLIRAATKPMMKARFGRVTDCGEASADIADRCSNLLRQRAVVSPLGEGGELVVRKASAVAQGSKALRCLANGGIGQCIDDVGVDPQRSQRVGNHHLEFFGAGR